MSATLDIIVPVYRGEAETRACLESVLASRSRRAVEVIVVDDASPEPAISAWLRELAAAGRITLVRHDANRGFVASVNEGMALHPDRDVVLLNSDTEVAGDWADRLSAHALRDPTIATATPFSNNATVCSYPRVLAPNALPEGETTASLDAAMAAANGGRSVEIPTAVGFCMFVARRALDAVGAFDEAKYGAGYGEEVDFCMRAARAGFRNVLAGDVFVRHVGEVSFGGSGAERRARAQALVDSLYPEFQAGLRRFVDEDAAAPLRRAADLERLRRSPRPRVLFVTHAFGGGIRRHVDELARAIAGERDVVILQPHADSYVKLRRPAASEEMTIWFQKHAEWGALLEVLRGIGISRVHLHHVHGHTPMVLDLPAALGCAYDVTLHDYFAVCPQYHLTNGSGRYCGEPGGTRCLQCEESAPAQWPMPIPEWRERFGRFLAGAARVIAPSEDSAARIARYFPAVKARVRPHPQEAEAAPPRPRRVLVPGALSPEKGIGLLEACVRDAAARALPLHFRVLGYLAHPLPTWPALPLTVAGEYAEGTLPALIAAERGDAIFFPAQCPETYSYTLTEAIASGLTVVATDLGALPERLRGVASTRIVPWNAGASEINDALLAAAIEPRTFSRTAAAPVTHAAYAADYLEGTESAPVEPGALPALAAAWIRDPREAQRQPTLVQLYDDGVLCGRADSRQELRRQCAAAEQDRARLREAHQRDEMALAQARGQAAQLQAALEAAEARAAGAEGRARELESSTSWRLLAPVRALVHAWRRRRG